METLVAAAAVLAFLLGRAARRRVGFVVEVESVSMSPALTPGRHVLARRLRARSLRRGDIVVVDSVELGRPIVKRVVGLPGERIAVGRDGRVQVGGQDLDEPYVVHRGGASGVFDVPPDHLLLLGDNRAASSDARVWRAPYVPVSAVRGRVVRPRGSGVAGGTDRGSPPRGAAPTGPPRPVAATRGGG